MSILKVLGMIHFTIRIHVLVCIVHGASTCSCYRHFIVVNCTTMCSMNLLQAPNQHHFEVLIGVDWVTCIIEDSL